MKLTWLGHACFMLESSDGSVVFDPYAPNYVPGFELPELHADMCICSHRHDDHYYPQAVELTEQAHSLVLEQIPCFHDEKGGSLRGENLISIVTAEGLRVAHLGDLGHMLSEEQLHQLGKIDVLMIPIGGFYTIDSKTAAELVKKINPKIVVPMHYKGEGFGYDVLETRDNFLKMMDNVKYFDGRSIIISAETEPMTVALKID